MKHCTVAGALTISKEKQTDNYNYLILQSDSSSCITDMCEEFNTAIWLNCFWTPSRTNEVGYSIFEFNTERTYPCSDQLSLALIEVNIYLERAGLQFITKRLNKYVYVSTVSILQQFLLSVWKGLI